MIGALSLFAGVLAGLAMARAPTWPWLVAATIALLLAWLTSRHHAAVRLLAAFTLGACLSGGAIARWSDLVVAPAGGDSRVLLDAMIATTPDRSGTELRFDADVIVSDGDVDARPRRARLVWRDAPFAPRVGERWRLLVRLAPLDDTRNFSGPDLARIALRDRVHLSGRVLPGALNGRRALAPDSIDTKRARIAGYIRDAVADPDAAALLAALAVGLTDGVSRDQWRVFNVTGTTHLVAISGMHVTLFALLAFAVARRLWRFMPFGVARETFSSCAGLAAAGAYALLAGFSVPTQRTWLMLAIFVVARQSARCVGAARIWSLSLIAVLLLDPLAPLSTGFWLSFVAVGVLLFLGQGALSRQPPTLVSRARAAFSLQLGVMAMLAPLTVAVFGGVSIVGLGVNLLAIPLISFVFVPVILTGAVTCLIAPPLGALCFRGAAWLYEIAWPSLVAAADVDAALWRVSPAAAWYVVTFLASALLLRRWPWPLHLTSAVALLPLVFPVDRTPAAGVARIEVLDGGRGTSVLVETRSRLFVFDTGDSWGSEGARARSTVLPAVDARSRAIDQLLLPTLDPDRAAGAAVLAQERGLADIRVGGRWPASELPVRRCRDSTFRIDGLRFDTFAGGRGDDFCAWRISAGAHSLLIGGDFDAAAERALIRRIGAPQLASDAVVLSRHASALGSSPQWIEATHAGLAIAAGGANSGSRNEALRRWRRTGARIVDTRVDGAVLLELDAAGLTVRGTARQSRYPFAWRRLP